MMKLNFLNSFYHTIQVQVLFVCILEGLQLYGQYLYILRIRIICLDRFFNDKFISLKYMMMFLTIDYNYMGNTYIYQRFRLFV